MITYTPCSPLLYSKTGFAGVYIFSCFFFLFCFVFAFLLLNIDCGYSLERVPTIFVIIKNKKKKISKNYDSYSL